MPPTIFTGTWQFDPAQSNLPAPFPTRWIQQIVVEQGNIQVVEEIDRAGGEMLKVAVDANLDGAFYAVQGSPLIDEISYVLTDNQIYGVGRKNGVTTLHELVSFFSTGEMTMDLSFMRDSEIVASGKAHFLRQQ